MNLFLDEYILNYKVKKDYIIIHYASGYTRKSIYSKSNEEKLISTMKEQLKNKDCNDFIKNVKKENEMLLKNLCGLLCVLSNAILFMSFLFTSKYFFLGFLLAAILGYSANKKIKRQKAYNAVKKRNYYLENEELFNEENKKDLAKKELLCNNMPEKSTMKTRRRYNINNVEKATYKELKELVKSKTETTDKQVTLVRK